MGSYDFLADRTEDGRQMKLLVVLDEFTRECLAIEVARTFAAAREDKTARQDGGRVATRAGPAVGAAPLPPAQPANDQPILS